MKHLRILLAIFLLASSLTSYAQVTTAFDKEIAPWHKKATMQCGMIKAKPIQADKILSNLKELKEGLKAIESKYLDNPPKEYAKDPNWKSYFTTFEGNIEVLTFLMGEQKYAEAAVYCPTFCKTFGQMHKVNGTLDLTDVVFSWRMEMKNTNDMMLVGNVEGANKNSKVLEGIYNHVLAFKDKRNDKNFNELFPALQQAYLSWLKAFEQKDKEAMNTEMNKFMDAFPKPYMASFLN